MLPTSESVSGDNVTPDFFMKEALIEAKKAFLAGEVPVGAIIEHRGKIVGRGHNCTEGLKDPTAHAETIAIRQAAKNLGGWRLSGSNIYVTAEPCAMCAGAIVLARLDNIYIGAMDPKTGACGSLMNIPGDRRLNHNPNIYWGIFQEECSQLMKEFFKKLREQKSTQKMQQEDNKL